MDVQLEIEASEFEIPMSQILAVDINPSTNPIQINGQNGGMPNSWTGESVPQATSHYNKLIPYPQQSTYLNNYDNQQHINYEQHSPMPQPYNEPHNLNLPQQSTTPQQFIPQDQNYLHPTFKDPFSESVNQQLTNMQYSNQNVNTPFKQPVINQKNENQQSQIPQSYNLHPQSQSEPEASQSFGTIKPQPPKEYQTQTPTRLNHPIPDEELPDFGELPRIDKLQDIRKSSEFGKVKTRPENAENKPVQVPSKIIPQLSQQTSFNSKSELPGNYFFPPKSPFPPKNQSQLPQVQSQGSLKPSNRISSTPNENTIEIKNEAMPNPKPEFQNSEFPQATENQFNVLQPSPSIPSNSNTFQLPQVPPRGPLKPLNRVSSKPNENTTDKTNESLLNPRPKFQNSEFPQATENKLNLLQPSPSIPSNSNKSQLPQVPPRGPLKPLNRVSSKPNKNTTDKTNELLLTPRPEFQNSEFPQATENKLNLLQPSPSIPSNSNKSQLNQFQSQGSLKPLNRISSTPNENTIEIKNEAMPNPKPEYRNSEFPQTTENQFDVLQPSPSIPSNSNKSQLNQFQSQGSLKPLNRISSTPNENTIEIKNEAMPNPKPEYRNSEFPQTTENQFDVLQSSPSMSSNSNKSQLPQVPSRGPLKPLNRISSTPNENTMKIKNEAMLNPKPELQNSEFPQPTENQLPLSEMASLSSLELLDKGPSTPNKLTMVIEDGKPFNSQLDFPIDSSLPTTQNQLNLPQSSPSAPIISNQLPLSQIPSQSSSELLDKGPSSPNINIMQNKNEGLQLNPLSIFPNDKSEPFISNVAQSEKILIDSSKTDLQTFLNPENNDNLNPLNNLSENQDYFQLELNGTPSKLLMDNTQVGNVVINDPQQGDLIKDIKLYDDTHKSQIPLNASSLPVSVVDTQLNEELILEKAMTESPVFLLNKDNKEKYTLNSLEDLVFDEALEDGLSKYAKSDIVNTENPEHANQDKPKISVFANPNDIHTLQISSNTQPSTSDNYYSRTNYLLNSSPADVPWYKPSFPNTDIQQSDLNANNQQLSSLLNYYQYPLNQIPMYPPNNNDYNQQDNYSAVGQNQITSNIQFPGFSRNANQPSSKDNSGCIYKKVELRNPPPDSYNSWLLLNKDYTRNSNHNNRYTSYDGKTRTSTFGIPSTSYQNNIQEISNLSSNDMFVQNMMPMNSLNAIKAIFDVTRVNFPRAPLSHIIRLTNAIVQSVMRSLQQNLNIVMNTLYGRRSKRGVNPSEALHNLPGALIDKYSQKSTITPTAKYMNTPYYTQPDTTGKQPIEYFESQPIESILQQQQQQMYYDGVTDMNYYGSRDNNNISVMPQPVNIQNPVLNSIVDAIIPVIRSNVPYPYIIETPEVKQYTQQVIVTVEKVFKKQIDNILYGHPPTMNV